MIDHDNCKTYGTADVFFGPVPQRTTPVGPAPKRPRPPNIVTVLEGTTPPVSTRHIQVSVGSKIVGATAIPVYDNLWRWLFRRPAYYEITYHFEFVE